jgi:phosphatidate cytidylyltransferase
VSRKGDDSEGFDPHPGDPWHPEWSSGEEDDDLFTVPEPDAGEGRAGFFRRFLTAKEAVEEVNVDDAVAVEDSSVEHVFDTIRAEPDRDVATDPDDSYADDGEREPVVVPEIPAEMSFEAETATAEEAEWEFEDVDLLEQALDQHPPEELLVALERFEAAVAVELADVDKETLADELAAVTIGVETAARQSAVASAVEHEQLVGNHVARREAVLLTAEITAATMALERAWSREGAAAARAFEAGLADREATRAATAERDMLRSADVAMTTAAAGAADVRAKHVHEALDREAESFEIDLMAAEALAVDSEIEAAVETDARIRAAAAAAAYEDAVRSRASGDELGTLSTETEQMRHAVSDQRLRYRAGEQAAIAAAWEASIGEELEDGESDDLIVELTSVVLSIDTERAVSMPEIHAGSDESATSLDGPATDVAGLEFVGEEVAEEEEASEEEAESVIRPVSESAPEPSSDVEVEDIPEPQAETGIEPVSEVALIAAVAPRAERRSWWRRIFRRSARATAVGGAAEVSTAALFDEADDPEPDDGGEEAEATGALPVASGLMMDEPTADDSGEDEELPLEPDEPADPSEDVSLAPGEPDVGFDGWLDDDEAGGDSPLGETAPIAEEYAELEDDEAEAEVAGWLAFTQGADDEVSPAEADVSPAGDASPHGEVEVPEPAAGVPDDVALSDSTEDLPVDHADEDPDADTPTDDEDDGATGDGGDGDGGDGDGGDGDGGDGDGGDDGNGDDGDDDDGDDDDEDDDTSEFDLPELEEADDTDEIPVGMGFAPSSQPEDQDDVHALSDFDGDEMWEDEAAGLAAAAASGFVDHDVTEEHYIPTGTSDHADLAQAVARAGAEDTEQVALSAEIPGLESNVVGFDDVVEAEGTFAGTAKRSSSDLPMRIITGVLLVATFFAALLWRPALIFLAIAVFLIAAGEFYTALMQRGYQPLAIFGFIGILAAGIGTTLWGVIAIPVSVAVTMTLLLLFFGVVPGRRHPLTNFSVTVLVLVWIGVLGSFAFDIFGSEDYRTLVIAAVLAVAIVDIAQYFAGRAFGRHQLAPVVSPKKTIEGLVGGVVVSLLIGAALHFFPPFDLASGLAFGAIVAVFAPLGDLAVSAVKRSLDVKDMGTVLPGHGGLLDRIDGLMFVIPAAWVLFEWLGYL